MCNYRRPSQKTSADLQTVLGILGAEILNSLNTE